MTVEGSRLEGVILRSQLLVLLQRRHFCDQHGRPVGREYSEKQEIELEVGLVDHVLLLSAWHAAFLGPVGRQVVLFLGGNTAVQGLHCRVQQPLSEIYMVQLHMCWHTGCPWVSKGHWETPCLKVTLP